MLCVAGASAADTLTVVHGHVRDAHDGRALPNVHVQELNTRSGTFTGEDGAFEIRLPDGDARLKVSHIGYAERTVALDRDARHSTVDIALERSATLLEEVTVSSHQGDRLHSPQMGMLTVSREKIKSIPTLFGEADVIKALQTQPGVSSGTEGLTGMYVRGGSEDENLYMLDGIPLYRVAHLGGLFSAFNVEAVDGVVFYKSSFPARYGGRLSSVLDVRTRTGDHHAFHGSAMLGLTSGSLYLEGPVVKGKTSFIASMRRSWLEALSVPALALMNNRDKDAGKKTFGQYAFTDVNVKINHRFSERSHAYAGFYYGNDRLKIGERIFSEKGFYFVNENISRLDWGNTLAYAGWSYRFSDKWSVNVAPSFTRYASSLARNVFNNSGLPAGADYEERRSARTTENGIDDLNGSIHFDWHPSRTHHVNFGMNYTRHHFLPELNRIRSVANGVETEVTGDGERLSAHEAAFHAEEDWTLSSAVRLTGGIRLGMFDMRGKTYRTWEPRLSARLLLSGTSSVKFSYSKMNQFVQQISDSYISLPTDFWMPVGNRFEPLESRQFSSGYYYENARGYSFALEGYYKEMNHLLEYREGYSFAPATVGWDDKLTAGRGWSYGMEATVQKESGRLTGMVGYGLMWADRQFDEINLGKRYPAKYDNRHKVNIVANYKLSDDIELNGNWTYVTGNRITLSLEEYPDLNAAGFGSDLAPQDPFRTDLTDYYEDRNNVRLPAYHRLDLGISLYRRGDNGRTGIWNIGVWNAYNRMNPIVIQKNTLYFQESGRKANPTFRTTGIFPLIPSVSYTYKF
jgi:hypothetical protein